MVRPREFEEDEVVLAAMETFWQRGYQGTSIQDLVSATGLQRGSLYGAFGDKHGLFLAALDAYTEGFVEKVRALVASEEDPVDGLRLFIRSAGAANRDAQVASRGCMVGNTCSELVAHDPDARERVERFVSEMQNTMADALRQGQQLGTFGTDRDPMAVAIFIQCSMQGVALISKTRPGEDVVNGVISEILRVLD
jgi:TetR/AcrR family transcriptional regulator, transcriptional repressor for nem operon